MNNAIKNPNIEKMNRQPWDQEANYMLNVGGRTILPPNFKPIVSFLISAWNPMAQLNKKGHWEYPWLEQSIESCLKQLTSFPFEVVLIDDGSDNPIKLNGDRGTSLSRDPRLSIYRIPHQGLAVALNFGLSKCRADIILRLDSDDIAAPWRIAKSAQLADNDLMGGSMTAIANSSATLARIPTPRWTDPLEYLKAGQVLCWHPTWAFKKAAILEVGGYPLGYDHAEDFALQCKLVMAGKKIANVPDMMTSYRRHDGQMSRIHNQEQRDNTQKAIKEILCDNINGDVTILDQIATNLSLMNVSGNLPNSDSTSKVENSTAIAAALSITDLGCISVSKDLSASPKKPKKTKKASSA